MNGNYYRDPTGALLTAGDKDTSECKQTAIKPPLFHNREKIEDNSTFNGAALTSNELVILWNKFKMHGHFKVEENFQDTIVPLLPAPNNNSINQTECLTSQCNKESSRSFANDDSSIQSWDQTKQIPDEWYMERMPNMYNSLALNSSENNMPVYSTVNNIESAVCVSVPDNMLDQFVNESNQSTNQYLDNHYYPLHDIYNQTTFFNTSNSYIFDDKTEYIANDSQYTFIDISNNVYQSNDVGALSNGFICYDNNICHES